MHRIDGPSAALGGLFRSGNPQVGQQATLVGVDWLNDLQENICVLIEAAGIALEKGESGQLMAGVQALDVEVFKEGKVYADGKVAVLAASIAAQLALKSPLASPVFTGVPTAPTAVAGENSLILANTAWVKARIAEAVAAATAAARVPVGVSMYNNSTVVPAGWYEEDGAVITRGGDPDLWTYAQASGQLAADAADKLANPFKFGRGDGVTTFQLPDKRGYFTRVWDHGAGRDVGRGLGTDQDSQNKAHTHGLGQGVRQVSPPNTNGFAGTDGLGTTLMATDSSGGSEARPRNGASMSIIKR